MKMSAVLSLCCLLLVPLMLQAEDSAPPSTPEWVTRSNENAKVLLDVMARQSPEAASRFGVEGFDTEIFQLPPNYEEKAIADMEAARKILSERLSTEKDAAVRQDLEILIHAVDQEVEGTRISEKYDLPYFDLSQTVFFGIRSLLDDRVPAERRPAALVRLKKYAGLEKGYTPITKQAEAVLRARLDDGDLQGPFVDNLKKDLANSQRFIEGIEQLFQKYQIKGYEKPYAALESQLAEYNAFLEKELMPRARSDFRLPAEQYSHALAESGIDMPVDELVSRAKTSFREIQNEMQTLANLIAKQKGYASSDYRDVIRELKKDQLVGEAILPHYVNRNKQIEALIREHHVISLPQRELKIRLASEAESAATPAPHMDPPRLIGNTGESGYFVLPLRIPSDSGKGDVGFDDFTFDAASWTLSVHEGRPGHELQFDSIIEKGVSQARAFFALNSVNAEGWALYMEAEMKPYEPLDGQLIALQHRLLRAARAFLDPGLQRGTITRDEAYRILENEVVVSHPMANQEVERYTFWAPGQAPSYFCGYSRLMEMRTDAERILGDRFDRQSYHDFILSQGLLPPRLLRAAVMDEYVPAHQKKPAGIEP